MIRMIAIDETELWGREFISRFPEETKLLGIYCYDDSRKVFLCEMTGSRELHFLGTIPTKVSEDDSIRDKSINSYTLFLNDFLYWRVCREWDRKIFRNSLARLEVL